MICVPATLLLKGMSIWAIGSVSSHTQYFFLLLLCCTVFGFLDQLTLIVVHKGADTAILFDLDGSFTVSIVDLDVKVLFQYNDLKEMKTQDSPWTIISVRKTVVPNVKLLPTNKNKITLFLFKKLIVAILK